eukprot:g3011.t1
MSRFAKKRRKPKGYDYLEPVLNALDMEMRKVVDEPSDTKRQNEALWPIHQITWQRSRYVFDMYYKYKKISRQVFEYCKREKIIDGALCAMWRKPGYDRLCSVHVVNTRNTNYGTTSICRVPRSQLAPGTIVFANLTGCRGCASGKEGYKNIFGNKYGQYLADIQIGRETNDLNVILDDSKEEESLANLQSSQRTNTDGKGNVENSWLGGNEKDGLPTISNSKRKRENSNGSIISKSISNDNNSHKRRKRNIQEVEEEEEGSETDEDVYNQSDTDTDEEARDDVDTDEEGEMEKKQMGKKTFIPSAVYTHFHKGYYFRRDHLGTGYYLDK